MSVIGSSIATIVLASVLGNLWNWVAGVFARIGDVSVYWLVLALALKAAESALIGLSWRNILNAAYPAAVVVQDRLGRVTGRNCNQRLAPAQAGTAAMIGIFRTSIPGSTVAGVASALSSSRCSSPL